MKSLTTALALSLVFIAQTLKAQVPSGNFPPLEHVYKQLDQQLKKPCKDCFIDLAKKKDGYYVMFVSYNDFKYEHAEYSKIWDAATGKYLTVDFGKHLDLKVTNPGIRGHELIRQKEAESDLNYLYGYPDYIKDLINDLEGKKELKTNELEMLARAYYATAINYIHPNFSGKILSETKDLQEPGYEKVSISRLKSFQEFAGKSITCYQKIKTMNPNYQPLIIKKLDLKINEDLMDYYLTMKSVQEPELAQLFFDSIQFSSTEVEAAKSILNNCKNGAFLFVSGDNTTYPLLYVQDKYDFRKDVSVINSSLLQTSWYFDYVRQTSKAKIDITLETFRDLKDQQVIPSKKGNPVTFKKWFDEVKSSRDANGSKTGVSQLPVSYEEVYVMRNAEKINISFRNSIYISDIVVLDILANNPESPVYADNPSIFYGLDVAQKFAQHGAIFEFTGKNEKSFTDSESSGMLKQSIEHSKLAFTVKTGPVETWVFQSWCFGINSLYRVDSSAAQKLYKEFKSKMEDKIILKGNDQGMIKQYKALMENLSAKDLSALYRMYSPIVTKILSKIPEKELLTRQNMELISNLQDLYFPVIDPVSGKFTYHNQEQKNTLMELNTKVKALMENPENQKTLSWTYEELLSVNDRFKDLGL